MILKRFRKYKKSEPIQAKPDIPRVLLDIKDLEQALCFKRDYICELRDAGVLEMTRVGKKYVITRNKLNEFLEKVDSGEIGTST